MLIEVIITTINNILSITMSMMTSHYYIRILLQSEKSKVAPNLTQYQYDCMRLTLSTSTS